MLVEGWWVWACFVATGPGHLTIIESTMNSFRIPKYCRVKCDDIHPTAKAWPKLGHATGQWSQTLPANLQNVAMAQSKSRPHADWNHVVKAVHKHIPTNLNKLEQCKTPPERCERLIKSYRKILLYCYWIWLCHMWLFHLGFIFVK